MERLFLPAPYFTQMCSQWFSMNILIFECLNSACSLLYYIIILTHGKTGLWIQSWWRVGGLYSPEVRVTMYRNISGETNHTWFKWTCYHYILLLGDLHRLSSYLHNLSPLILQKWCRNITKYNLNAEAILEVLVYTQVSNYPVLCIPVFQYILSLWPLPLVQNLSSHYCSCCNWPISSRPWIVAPKSDASH